MTFEHLMMMQLIPEDEYVQGIDVDELNEFIKQESPKVMIYWKKLVEVDISEIKEFQQPQAITTCLTRI